MSAHITLDAKPICAKTYTEMRISMNKEYQDNETLKKTDKGVVKSRRKLNIHFFGLKSIINIIIIAALVIALIYTKKAASTNYQSDGKITQIGFENIGELATQSVTTTSVRVETKDRKLFNISIPLTESKYIYTYNTNIKAGINFSDVTWNVGDTEDTKHTIYVTIPEVKTLSADLDLDSFKVLHESTSIFTPITLTEHNDALKQLTDDALNDAIGNGLYDKALENAKTLLTSFIYQVYPSDQYTIVFTDVSK